HSTVRAGDLLHRLTPLSGHTAERRLHPPWPPPPLITECHPALGPTSRQTPNRRGVSLLNRGAFLFAFQPFLFVHRYLSGARISAISTPALARDLTACWNRGGGLPGGLLLRDLGTVDDPKPGAIGLATQDLHAHAGVVGRAGRGQR